MEIKYLIGYPVFRTLTDDFLLYFCSLGSRKRVDHETQED